MFTPIQLLPSYNDSKRATTPAELCECHPTHRTAATAGRSHLCCPAASSVYILSPGNLKASLRPRSDLVHILFLVMSSDRRHHERHRTVACHPTHPSAGCNTHPSDPSSRPRASSIYSRIVILNLTSPLHLCRHELRPTPSGAANSALKCADRAPCHQSTKNASLSPRPRHLLHQSEMSWPLLFLPHPPRPHLSRYRCHRTSLDIVAIAATSYGGQ
jgi:hypothetical protein